MKLFSPGPLIFVFSWFIYKLNGPQMAYFFRIKDIERRGNDSSL